MHVIYFDDLFDLLICSVRIESRGDRHELTLLISYLPPDSKIPKIRSSFRSVSFWASIASSSFSACKQHQQLVNLPSNSAQGNFLALLSGTGFEWHDLLKNSLQLRTLKSVDFLHLLRYVSQTGRQWARLYHLADFVLNWLGSFCAVWMHM